MLARPDRRLTNIDPWILANPRSQDIEIVTSLKWDLLASLFVKQVAPLVTKVAIESRVCTSTDRQQWFVHVSNLENDALALVRPNGHHLAASFPSGMCAALATSYSTPSRDSRFCSMLMPSQNERGKTVTQAPESIVISISVHSSGLLMVLMPGLLTCCNMLSPAVDDG